MSLSKSFMLVVIGMLLQSVYTIQSHAGVLKKTKFECVSNDSTFIPQGTSVYIDLNNSKEFYFSINGTDLKQAFSYVDFNSDCNTCLEGSFINTADNRLWKLFLVPVPGRPSPKDNYELYFQNDLSVIALKCREVQ